MGINDHASETAVQRLLNIRNFRCYTLSFRLFGSPRRVYVTDTAEWPKWARTYLVLRNSLFNAAQWFGNFLFVTKEIFHINRSVKKLPNAPRAESQTKTIYLYTSYMLHRRTRGYTYRIFPLFERILNTLEPRVLILTFYVYTTYVYLLYEYKSRSKLQNKFVDTFDVSAFGHLRYVRLTVYTQPLNIVI